VRWVGEPVAKLAASDRILAPRPRILADEQLTGAAREAVQTRLDIWIGNHVTRLLGPLQALEKAEELQGLAKGIAFQLGESLGVLDRSKVAEDLKQLDQEQRASLRKHGVRFGAYHVYMPALMKPAPRTLAAQLWALNHGGLEQKGLDEIPHLAASGRTSIPADKAIDRGLYRIVGYRVCGERAVRVDILERLADIIRPAIAYRPGTSVGEPPAGAADGDGFVTTVQMTSLVGCSGEDFASILRGLGYRSEKRKGPAITQPIRLPAATRPAEATPSVAAGEGAGAEPEAAAAAEGEVVISGDSAIQNEAPQEPLAAAASSGLETAVDEAPPSPATEAAPMAAAADEQPVEEMNAVTSAAEAEAPAPQASIGDDAPASPPQEVTPEAAAAAEGVDVEHAGEAAAPAPDEVPEIEVWRPARFERHARPQTRHHQRHGERWSQQRREGAAPADKEAPSAAQPAQPRSEEKGPRRFERGRDRDKREERPREGRPREERPREERRGDERRDGRRSEGRSFQGRDERRDRKDRGERNEHERGARAWSSEPRPSGRDNRQPDPNSPFAKLLALKEQLQQHKPEKGQ
jgi:ATP-dependent RNA helicase SUPV3L1/SUV3